MTKSELDVLFVNMLNNYVIYIQTYNWMAYIVFIRIEKSKTNFKNDEMHTSMKLMMALMHFIIISNF